MNRRYFIKLAYNGTNYHGWQIQDNSNTVQEELNKALSRFFSSGIIVHGCGRTDTGVHAKEFYAHFDVDKEIENVSQVVFKLNKALSKDIAIYEIFPVKPDVHARFDAISRTYEYFISRKKDPFYKTFSYYLYGDLDVDLMNKGARILYEYEDFSSFSKSKTEVITNNCKIMNACWEKRDSLLVFKITADRFLRNMVRAIVGTLLDLGTKKITIEEIRKIIESKSRSLAGYSVPANGLFLTHVEYPDSLF